MPGAGFAASRSHDRRLRLYAAISLVIQASQAAGDALSTLLVLLLFYQT